MKNLIIIICLLILWFGTSGCATFRGQIALGENQMVLGGNQRVIQDTLSMIWNDIAMVQLMIINMDKYQPTGFVEDITSIQNMDTDQTVFVEDDTPIPIWSADDPRNNPVVEIYPAFPEEDTIPAEPIMTDTVNEPIPIRWLDWGENDIQIGLRDDGVVVWREKK